MRGELSEANASLDVRHVLAACDHLATVTGGAFDARRHRADGRIDPSGYVKGWAIEEAAWLLDAAGARNYWINAGGDIVARGLAATGRPWRVGIRHPDQADRVAAVLEVSDRAVATSGDYERGDHVTDPRTGRAATGLRSVTVVGPRLAFTDAYATAVFAMGLEGLTWLAERRPRRRLRRLRHHRRRPRRLDRRDGPLPGPRGLTASQTGATPVAGRSTTKRAPPSARLATSMRPPWRSTIHFAIASPSPVPPPGAPGAR